MIKIYFSFFIFSLLLSCKPDHDTSNFDVYTLTEKQKREIQETELKPREFVDWIKDEKNGFYRSKIINDIRFSVLYKPIPYIICMEERKDEIYDSIYQYKQSTLQDLVYFTLEISSVNQQAGELLKYNLSTSEEYQNRINYYAFEISKDIKLVQDNNEINCAMSHFERTFDVAPIARIMVAFDKKALDSSKNFVFKYTDSIFEKGIIKITFSGDQLNTLPKLKTI